MATFKIQDDPQVLIENVKPKQIQQTFKFANQTNKNRAALQPVCSFQRNKVQQEAEIKKKMKDDKRALLPLNVPGNNIIKLKPVFKKSNLIGKPPNCLNEYEEDIWKYLCEFEKSIQSVRPCYMAKQLHLNWDMRRVLIDWLVNVADDYKMSEKTLHLSVNYLDRFLSNISVIREKFQLVGATAMMIAGKIEEIYPPVPKEWSYLTADAFSVKQFLKMEQLMLNVLNFELNTPTTVDFLKLMCSKHKIDNKTMHLAMYLSELVLLEGDEYLQYFPSQLAAASLALARHTLYKTQPWPKKIEESVGYTLKELSPVVQKQHKTFKSSPFKEQQSIQKKYSSEKYQKVALLKPRVLQLDDEE